MKLGNKPEIQERRVKLLGVFLLYHQENPNKRVSSVDLGKNHSQDLNFLQEHGLILGKQEDRGCNWKYRLSAKGVKFVKEHGIKRPPRTVRIKHRG